MIATDNGKDAVPRKKGISANRDHLYTGVPTVEYEDGRDEKPWQRVPSTLLVILIGVYLLLAYLTQLVEDDMPRVISELDARANTDTFSEEEAWRFYNTIIGDQPRVAGTLHHLQKTNDLKTLVNSLAAQAQTNQHIRADWQFHTGDYWLAFSVPHANVYQNVSNVIAVLEGESGFLPDGSIGTSILVNAHYDSVPYAVGASDDGLFCAIMMETLNKLSQRRERLKHNVVFLFNGAEENPLHGSHAFLSHPWSRNVISVVNLDAAGMNGKPFVFQATDPRALSAYVRSAYRPNGQSIGEFLFRTGIIPSDTDFRIWRDFGNYNGVDIAFVKWGHVYHTRYDHPSLVQAGVMQNAGNMLLALVRTLAESQELATPYASEEGCPCGGSGGCPASDRCQCGTRTRTKSEVETTVSVYYDYLNWFMVTYSYGAAAAIDVMVVVLASLSVFYYIWLVGSRRTNVMELLLAVGGRFVAMMAGIVVSAITIPLMVATTRQLRYLSEPWIVVPMYWLPYIIAAVCASQAFDAWRTKRSGLNRCIRTLQAQAATRLILAVVLLIMTCIPALTTVRYLITVPLFIMSITAAASLTIIRYFRMPAWLHLIMEVAFSLPTTMFMLTIALRFCALMMPIMGRSHTDVPDYTIGMFNVGLAILVCTSVSGLELLFSRKRLWWIATPLAVACVIIMFVPFSPYRDEGPSTQRHYWFHTEVITYDYNNNITDRFSGVVITKHDAYSTERILPILRESGMNMNSRTDFTNDCVNYVHCNLPLYRARFGEYLGESIFLHTEPPAPFVPESSTRLTSRSCAGEICTFNFVMTGPAHNMLTFWPRPNINITAWSLSSQLMPSFTQNNRPVYLITHSTPTYSQVFQPLQFSITLLVPLSQQSQPILDVSHHAHKIHHPEDYTAEYRNLVNAMPLYFNIASFMTFRRNYVF